jgi:molybdopterin-guanine dinucleotide biosynthesis protein A
MNVNKKFPVSITILLGGKSIRFKKNKALFQIGEKKLFEIVYDNFKDLSNDIFFQTSLPNTNSKIDEVINEVKKSGLRTNYDVYVDKGPLCGIYSALMNSKFEHLFVVAADMPFVDKNILFEFNKYLGFELIVPQWNNNYFEPLCAIYSKKLLPLIKECILSDKLGISKLYYQIYNEYIKYVNIEELIDKSIISDYYFNSINYESDIVYIKPLLKTRN